MGAWERRARGGPASEPPHFRELCLQEPHRVVLVKIREKPPGAAGGGGGGWGREELFGSVSGHWVLPERPALPRAAPPAWWREVASLRGPRGRGARKRVPRLQPGLALAEGPRRGHGAAGQCPCTQPQRPSPRRGVAEACSVSPARAQRRQGSHNGTREEGSASEPSRETQPGSSPDQHNASRGRPVCSVPFPNYSRFALHPKPETELTGRRSGVQRAGSRRSQTGVWLRVELSDPEAWMAAVHTPVAPLAERTACAQVAARVKTETTNLRNSSE